MSKSDKSGQTAPTKTATKKAIKKVAAKKVPVKKAAAAKPVEKAPVVAAKVATRAAEPAAETPAVKTRLRPEIQNHELFSLESHYGQVLTSLNALIVNEQLVTKMRHPNPVLDDIRTQLREQRDECRTLRCDATRHLR